MKQYQLLSNAFGKLQNTVSSIPHASFTLWLIFKIWEEEGNKEILWIMKLKSEGTMPNKSFTY